MYIIVITSCTRNTFVHTGKLIYPENIDTNPLNNNVNVSEINSDVPPHRYNLAACDYTSSTNPQEADCWSCEACHSRTGRPWRVTGCIRAESTVSSVDPVRFEDEVVSGKKTH